ncbi:hypothetical protein NUU61_006610 [Penicillium alfredii]|uniref:Uncharacterized protein n=1 Tax=Penicillium alfredii TaxID=1506179 RepID=A0A9W9K3S6_9EURO|nr:uncharacterized protein NUU61_006610 [Penicillium alfredii]KAJ5091740.1 hypothetical protein NUU61_006610 [Penicillium alfredii]
MGSLAVAFLPRQLPAHPLTAPSPRKRPRRDVGSNARIDVANGGPQSFDFLSSLPSTCAVGSPPSDAQCGGPIVDLLPAPSDPLFENPLS